MDHLDLLHQVLLTISSSLCCLLHVALYLLPFLDVIPHLLQKFNQESSSYQTFNLVPKAIAFRRVVAYVLMEVVVLEFVPSVSRSFHGIWLSE